jgi:NTE family protein
MDGAQELLHDVPLLRGLSAAGADALAAAAAPVDVPAGTSLFQAGDPADGMYLVLAGRLRVLAPDGRLLRVLQRGDVVGELALLTDRPRSATAIAARDAQLFPVARKTFRALLSEEPALLAALAQRLAEQLHTTAAVQPARRGAGVVAVVDAEPGHRTAESLLAHLPGVTVLDGEGAAEKWAQRVEEAERHGGVLLAAAPEDAAWQAFCRRTADRVVLVAGEEAPLGQDETGCDVLAVRLPAGRRWPTWATEMQPARRAQLGGAGAVAALAHRLAGTSPGAVLSGGGARGMAHLGVLAGLEDAGLRPERWGGCSMGAFVAALAATGRSATEVADVCRIELVRRHPFRDVAIPRHALSRARRLRDMLARVFGDLRVEDLPHDFFCVTADLTSGRQVVHREGLLRDVLAASMAVPGLAPPVRAGGQLLVDGGVLDNLPVGVMAATGDGPVVAVDVMRRSASALTDRPPSLFDTIAQSLTIGGRERLQANLATADAVVAPDLGDTGLLDFDRLERCVRAGRAAVDAAQPQLAELWP